MALPFPFSPEFDFEDWLADFLVDLDSGLDVSLTSGLVFFFASAPLSALFEFSGFGSLEFIASELALFSEGFASELALFSEGFASELALLSDGFASAVGLLSVALLSTGLAAVLGATSVAIGVGLELSSFLGLSGAGVWEALFESPAAKFGAENSRRKQQRITMNLKTTLLTLKSGSFDQSKQNSTFYKSCTLQKKV